MPEGKKRSASQNSPPILLALVGVDLNVQKLINCATAAAISLPPENGKMGDIMPTGIVRKGLGGLLTAWAFVFSLRGEMTASLAPGVGDRARLSENYGRRGTVCNP